MSFSVLRTLDYKKAGFDQLKQTAITQLGSGRNVKLNVQFNSRLWNAQGSTGSIYTDLPFQSGWDVTRAPVAARPESSSSTPARTLRSRSASRTRTRRRRTTRPSTKAVQSVPLSRSRRSTPASRAQWNGKAMLSTPFTDPNLLLLVLVLEARAVHRLQRLREACGRGTSTSPASTARSTSRATWKAARRKAIARRTRSSRI